MRTLRASSVSLALIAVVLAGFLAGCTSSRRDTRDRGAPQPLLFAQSAFSGGALTVEAQLGPFRFDDTDPAFNRRPPAPGEGEPVPVRDGTFGGRSGREIGTGFPRGSAEEGAFGEIGAAGGGRRGGPGLAGALPRQSMTVRFRSQSGEPIAVGVVEVKSALGNFVPVPESFTLQPGGVQVLEPMRSAYPAAIDELELLVSLRVRGKDETQILHLKP